jgi:hypothetical protein
MNARLFAVAVLSSAFAFGAAAQEAKPDPNAPKQGTKEERQAERVKARAANKEAVEKKQVDLSGEAKSADKSPASTEAGRAERRAERAKKRQELAEAQKKGQVPRSTEAGTTEKKQ